MAERKLGIGMVGAGFIGQIAHLMNYVEVPDCRVVALADFRPELRRRVAQRYEIGRTYPSHRELLADPDVEAVVVVTPRPHTAPVVADCIAAGKHVLSEKPMAGTAEQGQRLVDAARDRGVIYTVGYMKRHDEGVQIAKRLLDDAISSGRLGPVLSARAHCYMGESYASADGHVVTSEKADYADEGWPTAPSWLPAERRASFASFVNTYSHNTNLLRFLFGATPAVAYASLTRQAGQTTVLDFGTFSATLETGRGSSRSWDEITEVHFADGRLTLRTPPALLRNVAASVELYRAGSVQEFVAPQPAWSWAFRRQAQAFVEDVLGRREPLSPGADAVQDLRLIEEMWRVERPPA
jgi:predicted dehydrogenase